MVELHWARRPDDELRGQVHRIIHAVVAAGGAVGWITPPSRAEIDRWTDAHLALVATGDAALCLGLVDGVAQGMGCWRRRPGEVFAHVAEVIKIMAHPSARGLGLGRTITGAVVDDAVAAGFETLQLGVRGNNHVAIALYRDLGFVEWGRAPNVIAVGSLRFDDVQMVRQGPRPPDVEWRGSQAGGPGS